MRAWLAIWLGDVRVKVVFGFLLFMLALAAPFIFWGSPKPVIIIRNGQAYDCQGNSHRTSTCSPITEKRRRELLKLFAP